MTLNQKLSEMEEWRSYPGDPRYKVSNLGRVIGPRGFVLKSKDERGYFRISICKNGTLERVFAHRMVMESFVHPSHLEVDHRDGNPGNNKLENLRYVTASENSLNRRNCGTDNRGEKHNRVKLTNDKIIAIRAEYERKSRYRTNSLYLAEKYSVSRSAINKIISRKAWKHI